jgi:magnesium transporter
MGQSSPTGNLELLRDRLTALDTLGVVEELAHMESPERATAFRLLPKDRALAVFQYLDAAHQEELLQGLRQEQVLQFVESLIAGAVLSL